MDSNRFYVYIYLDPRKPGEYKYGDFEFDYEPFYIGKGSNVRKFDFFIGRNKFCLNKINKIIKTMDCLPVVITVKENLIEEDAFTLEIELIKIIGRLNLKRGPLTNLTDGGEGFSGYLPTEETRVKISRANTGLKRTKESRVRMSEAQKGKSLSGETRGKISKAFRKTYVLVKDGRYYMVYNLKQFCADNQINYSSMGCMTSGIRFQHKGWTMLREKQSEGVSI